MVDKNCNMDISKVTGIDLVYSLTVGVRNWPGNSDQGTSDKQALYITEVMMMMMMHTAEHFPGGLHTLHSLAQSARACSNLWREHYCYPFYSIFLIPFLIGSFRKCDWLTGLFDQFLAYLFICLFDLFVLHRVSNSLSELQLARTLPSNG